MGPPRDQVDLVGSIEVQVARLHDEEGTLRVRARRVPGRSRRRAARRWAWRHSGASEGGLPRRSRKTCMRLASRLEKLAATIRNRSSLGVSPGRTTVPSIQRAEPRSSSARVRPADGSLRSASPAWGTSSNWTEPSGPTAVSSDRAPPGAPPIRHPRSPTTPTRTRAAKTPAGRITARFFRVVMGETRLYHGFHGKDREVQLPSSLVGPTPRQEGSTGKGNCVGADCFTRINTKTDTHES